MLAEKCFSREWIEQCSTELNCNNPILLEKAIVALQLVGHLVEAGLPFQFKGGTSLLLLLNPIRRLSIDADIVTQATPQELEKILSHVGGLRPFTRAEPDPQRNQELPPKKHYQLLYPSVLPAPRDFNSHVLLDVLFEPACPAEPTAINTSFAVAEREVRVPVPGVNGLLGDKLTAFAPQTIGILYNNERSADIVKQLFDVAALFDAATDLTAVAVAYETAHANQCRYRQPFTLGQTLDDTIQACLELAQHDRKGAPKDGTHGLFFQDGISRLQGYLINAPFRRDEARIGAGMTACLAAWIKRRPGGVPLESLRFSGATIPGLANKVIGPPWAHLHGLRGANPAAFFYWLRAQELLQQ